LENIKVGKYLFLQVSLLDKAEVGLFSNTFATQLIIQDVKLQKDINM